MRKSGETSIEKAIRATSKDINDPLKVGFLQVEKLYDHVLETLSSSSNDFEFALEVKPPGKGESLRGIYLRGKEETERLYEAQVQVVPKIKEGETESKQGLDLQVRLSSSETWVKAPGFLALNSAGRSSLLASLRPLSAAFC
jgi:tripeptidyl-peptidase-2